MEYAESQDETPDVGEFVKKELAHLIDIDYKPISKPTDIVLYGFGRIGRLLTRLLIEQTGNGQIMRLRAIVVRKSGANDLEKRVNLLRNDSVHGSFEGTIRVDEENSQIIANGNVIPFIYSDGPDTLDYTEYDIHDALVIDNTGKWRDRRRTVFALEIQRCQQSDVDCAR